MPHCEAITTIDDRQTLMPKTKYKWGRINYLFKYDDQMLIVFMEETSECIKPTTDLPPQLDNN